MDEADYRAAILRVIASGMTGDKVYDSLCLGAALKCKAEKLHTSNKRDFAPFKAEIEIVTSPLSEHPPVKPAA